MYKSNILNKNKLMTKKIYFLLCAALLLALTACQSDSDDKYVEKPALDLYQVGLKEIKEQHFKKAGKSFEEVIRQHPYSDYATRAQLMAAFSYYKAQEYEEALASINAFIQLHPANEHIPYAHYLKGLCFYNQISSVERDQQMTEKAMDAFLVLIQRFPSNPYAKDAAIKIDLLKEYLAGWNMEVARFYEKKMMHLAALNRFKFVVMNYETTSHVPEALFRLVEVYLQLGLIKDAQAAAVVLGHNFPGNKWYQRAYDLLKGHNLFPKEDSLKIQRTWETHNHVAQPYYS